MFKSQLEGHTDRLSYNNKSIQFTTVTLSFTFTEQVQISQLFLYGRKCIDHSKRWTGIQGSKKVRVNTHKFKNNRKYKGRVYEVESTSIDIIGGD